MRALYRTTFRIKAKDNPDETMRDIANTCLGWIFDPNRKTVTRHESRPEDPLTNAANLDLGNAHTLDLRTLEDEGATHWGLRFQHPDFEDPTLLWCSELTLHPAQNGSIHFACSVLLGRSEMTFAPVFRPITRPRIIANILSSFQTDGIFPLRNEAVSCKTDSETINQLVSILESASRKHPLVLISTYEGGKIMVEENKIASHLAGLAHVVVAESDEVGRALCSIVGEQRSTFGGQIRIYWPGFKRDCNPYDHSLFTRNALQQMKQRHPTAISQELLSRIASAAVFTVTENFLTWQKLQSLARKAEIEEARQQGCWEAYASMARRSRWRLRLPPSAAMPYPLLKFHGV